MNKAKDVILLAKEKGYSCDKKGNAIGPKGNILVSPTKEARNGRQGFTIRTDLLTGKRSTSVIPLHRWIAFCKFGNRIFDEALVVRHLDGNVRNNSWNNLDLGSQSDNMMDRPEAARILHAKRAASFVRKFTDQEELEIRKHHSEVRSYKHTMEKFGIGNKATLHYILKKSTARSSIG